MQSEKVNHPGSGHRGHRFLVRRIQRFICRPSEKYSADALLLVTPYYNKATQKGLKLHFSKIAESVKLPIILYNVPSRTGCNLQPETIVWLAEHVENIVGVKEASGNISQVAKLMSLAKGNVELYSGNDDQIVRSRGAWRQRCDFRPVNVAPELSHDIATTYLEGDVKKSCELQLQAIELIDALFCEVNPIPVKTALNLMGKEVGPLRAPLLGTTQAAMKRKLRKALVNSGIAVK